MIKKTKERIINLGLNLRKEITIFIILNVSILLVGITLVILLKNLLLLIAVFFVLLVTNYLYISRYQSLENAQKESNLKDLTNIITFFKVYLENGFNVYTSLKEVSEFANPFLHEKLLYLLHQIDEDKSVQPFINFAKNFDELIIEQLFISIYQMVDEGNNSSYLRQFELIFNKLSSEIYNNEFLKKEKRLSSTTMFPLIGSGLLIIMITIGVVQVIGEMLYGL